MISASVSRSLLLCRISKKTSTNKQNPRTVGCRCKYEETGTCMDKHGFVGPPLPESKTRNLVIRHESTQQPMIMLTLNIFHFFLYWFYCWLWQGKCLLRSFYSNSKIVDKKSVIPGFILSWLLLNGGELVKFR